MKNANRLVIGNLRTCALLLERNTPNATRMVIENLRELAESVEAKELFIYFEEVNDSTNLPHSRRADGQTLG